jgi:hypothetical protein
MKSDWTKAEIKEHEEWQKKLKAEKAKKSKNEKPEKLPVAVMKYLTF